MRGVRGKGKGQGPAKGPGNGNPPHRLDTSSAAQRLRKLKYWADVRRKAAEDAERGDRSAS